MFWRILPLPLGFLIDLCIGDPAFLYHPVKLIGTGISLAERSLRALFSKTPRGEQAAGTVLVVAICILSVGIPVILLWVFYHWHTWIGVAAETFLCYQLLASKSLKQESMKVYEQLKNNHLEGARHAVSMIVGRDTQNLTGAGITKAAVETIAENTSDGVIAPMLYMALGGVPLMFLYKAINTMDSMIGYKNDRYLHFGRCAAKLDDAVNYLPARISAGLMMGASLLLKLDWKNGIRIYKRDRYQHASPNAAQTEAVMAGALNIQLAGDAWYFGKLYKKPVIGDDNRKIKAEDIGQANRLLYMSACLGVILFTGMRIMFLVFLN
jgi:adenosylcobinamide-phosphate synthase